MKNNFRNFFLIIGFIMILSSCSLLPRKNNGKNPKIEKERIMLEGILRKIELSVYMQGTHKIVKEVIHMPSSGETYKEEILLAILQSKTLDLNNFLDKKVRIEGVLTKTIEGKTGLIDVKTVETLEKEKTVSMKKFKSAVFKINFSYPSSYKLKKGANSIELWAKDKNKKNIAIKILDNQKAIKDKKTKTKEALIKLDGENAKRFVYPEGDTDIYADYGKKTYIISYIPISKEKPDEEKSVFYDFLRSFHFIRKIDEASKPDIKICGGEANVICEPGFRCELESEEKDAEGRCVPIGFIDNIEEKKQTETDSLLKYQEQENKKLKESKKNDATINSVIGDSRHYRNERDLFELYYPKNWYFANQGINKVWFSSKPPNKDNVLVKLEVENGKVKKIEIKPGYEKEGEMIKKSVGKIKK